LTAAPLEAQQDEGPCRESHRTGRPVPPVSLDDPEVAVRRTEFTACARRHGGGTAVADASALGLRNHRVHGRFRTLSGQSQHTLTSRVPVEQAKGIPAERRGIDVDEAFDALRRYARRNRLPLDSVTLSVVEQGVDDAELGRGEARPPLGPPRTWRDTCGNDG